MKKAENHQNHPRRSWALNHMGNVRPNGKSRINPLIEHAHSVNNQIDSPGTELDWEQLMIIKSKK
jgi:hypothetical protein